MKILDRVEKIETNSGCCCGGTPTDQGGAGADVPETDEGVRKLVQSSYGAVASGQASCCATNFNDHAQLLGYSDQDLANAPDEANLGLGCGNPTVIAELQPGQVVVDLGSGAGLDAFIVAEKVGPEGRVIGIDMTPEMLERARGLAVKMGVADRVEFREGIIEKLPVVDDSVDVVMSNCVINLSPDKAAVFGEAFRILKPGGKLAVSDILLTQALDPTVKNLAALHVGCIAGALLVDDYMAAITDAGFENVTWTRVPAGDMFGTARDPAVMAAVEAVEEEKLQAVLDSIWSYKISAEVPCTP